MGKINITVIGTPIYADKIKEIVQQSGSEFRLWDCLSMSRKEKILFALVGCRSFRHWIILRSSRFVIRKCASNKTSSDYRIGGWLLSTKRQKPLQPCLPVR